LLEILPGFPEVLKTALAPVIAATEIGIVRIGVHGTRFLQTRFFLGCQLDADLPRHRPRHLALNRHYVAQITIVALGPQVPFGYCLDQLRRDSHFFSRAQHRAFNNAIHMQLAGNLRQRFLATLCIASPKCARSRAER